MHGHPNKGWQGQTKHLVTPTDQSDCGQPCSQVVNQLTDSYDVVTLIIDNQIITGHYQQSATMQSVSPLSILVIDRYIYLDIQLGKAVGRSLEKTSDPSFLVHLYTIFKIRMMILLAAALKLGS